MKANLRRLGLTMIVSAGVISGLLTGALVGTAEAATTTGTVNTGGSLLNVRIGPAATTARKTMLPDNTRVTIVCQEVGQKIWGRVRTTNMWDRLPDGTYVSDAYISRGTTALPRCPALSGQAAQAPLAANRGWVSPVMATVGSGFRTSSRPTHDGVDMAARKNTPIRAVSGGTVITSVCNASTNNCDVDGSPSIRGCGWYVEVEHAGKIVTRYCHMIRRPSVSVGQKVFAGQVIGFVGSSGNSSGPHLHFEVHTGTPADRSNAVEPVAFLRTKGVKLGE
jgi:murein DD-endopeptidase MepM/ murein hydrolase activator NlpD